MDFHRSGIHTQPKHMKHLYFLSAMLLAGCTGNDPQKETSAHRGDTIAVRPAPAVSQPAAKIYSNERFKEVTVEQTGEHTFLVQGKGQIFEASFNWVVEDGHNELKKGYEMTDAGAPEWGTFSFKIDVEKERANSTLMLILFESSPKDGSRQYELPVLLY